MSTLVYARVATVQTRDCARLLGAHLREARDVEVPLQVPPSSLVALSRTLAQDSCRLVEEVVGTPLDDLLDDARLSSTFRARLTLRLVLKELPPLLQTLQLAKEPLLVLDSGLTDRQLALVAATVGGPVGVRSHVPPGAPQEIGGAGPRERASREAVRPGGMLLVCGSPTDLAFLLPSARLNGGRPVTVLLKNDRPEALRAAAELAGTGARVLPARRLRAVPLSPGARAARARVVRSARGAGPVFPLLRELVRCLDMVAALDEVLTATEPAAVIGALDRSPVGGALAGCAGRSATRVLDVQHGTYLPAGVMDLLAFDAVLAWNHHSADRFVQDGHTGEVVVVGNPRWDLLARAEVETSPTAAALRDWKGTRRLLLHLPQPAKGPYLTEKVLERTGLQLVETLERRPELLVLVKERPRAADGSDVQVLQARLPADRLRVVTDEQLGLAQALELADAVVSVYSTALADALASGRAAASLDVGGVVPALGLDFLTAVPVCADAEQLGTWLDELPAVGRTEPPVEVLPRFDRPYEDRLGAVLEPVLRSARPAQRPGRFGLRRTR